MSHNVIDNRTEKLVDHIRRVLPGSDAAKFAVGYFFLSGLEAVADQLYNVQNLRLLIGNTSNRETIEQLAEGYRRLEQVQGAAEALLYPKNVQKRAAVEATAANVGSTAALMDQTDGAEQPISNLVRLIEEGRLEVRVYTQGRLHAKAYIFDYGPSYDAQGRPVPQDAPGMAIVGSSNFTLSGVTTNTELNVKVYGADNHAALTAWFEDLWDEAEPFEKQLMRELRGAWPLAEVTPYEIYLKTLYELVREQLEGEEGEEFLWRDDIAAVLTEFQDRAVRQAVQMIRRYGGCFVADVVGLGKSYVGAAIIKHFERHDRARPLIICPAPLVEMWEHYNEAYQLNARVLSMGQLREDEEHGPEWMLYDERYRYRDFVLVDESHNFRNTGTQRYRVLQSYLATGDRQALFLTATPRNKSIWDIYNQIQLFHPEEVTELPIEPPHLKDFFKLVEKGERRLQALLAPLLIRRTRAHVLRWYGYDAETNERVDPQEFDRYRHGDRRVYVLGGGRQNFFPERELRTVEYSIEETYGGLYDRLRCYISPPQTGDGEGLTYARYGLWNYVRREKQEARPYVDLKRAGANLRGLMRVLLFKRFESSVHAFRETVRRMLRIHRDFLRALDAGVVAAGEEAQSLLYGSDVEEEQLLLDALEEVSGRYDPADFDLAALRADVAHDTAVLEQMLELVEPITPERDAKLARLQALLSSVLLERRKVLVFTQYADTAQYLYDHLPPSLVTGDGTLEVIYSQDKSKAQIVARFAPRANPQYSLPEGLPEIDLLIATDVLSEGLNLQDCDNVVNYDLHWNPVRLIQRFGRIDRIGSRHETIYAYNFLPERQLERNLQLQQKLERRIQEIHQTIGEDAAILHPDEQVNAEAMYAIYSGGDLAGYEQEEVDAYLDLNEAAEIVRQLQEDQPELYARIRELRDGVRCGYRTGQEGAVVFCRAGRYRQLYLVDEAGEVVTREVPRILNLMRCEPGTPAHPLPAGYNQLVMQVKRAFDAEVTARRAEQQHTVSLTRAQRYVLRELRVLYNEADDDTRQQIDLLTTTFNQTLARPAIRSALNKIRREGMTGEALLRAVSSLYHLHGLDKLVTQIETQEEEAPNGDLPRIVCSEAQRGHRA